MPLLARIECSLDPSFGGWGWLVFTLACVLFAFLVPRLRRGESDQLPRRLHRLLSGMRLAILSLLAFLILFQPRIRNVSTTVIPSHVLVAVDVSGSMKQTDGHAPAAELFKTAAKVGYAPAGSSVPDMTGWSLDLANGLNPREDRYKKTLEELRKTSRTALAAEMIDRNPDGLAATLRQNHTVRELAFSDKVLPRSLGAATDGETDFARLLHHALEQPDEEGSRCVGIVIVTDGRRTRGAPPESLADKLAAERMPVFPIVVGTERPAPDIAVRKATATPRVAFKKSTVRIEAEIVLKELGRGKVLLKLIPKTPGFATLEQTFEHDGKTELYVKEFEIPADEPGDFEYVVKAEWLGTEKARRTNDERPASFQVIAEKARVLLVDSEMRYETHYLRVAMLRDESVKLKTVILNPPRIDVLPQAALKEQAFAETDWPADFAEFMGYDCIIVGDVDFRSIPDKQRTWLDRYVTERGGTLVLVAGKKYMPVSVGEARFFIPDPTLAKLLPIRNQKIVAEEDGFNLKLTEEGGRTGFLQLAPDSARNRSAWDNLPRSFWAVTGRAKEGAVPLAFVPPRLEENAERLPSGQEKEHAVIVRQNIGFGKTVFVGIDSTWRWRFRQGDATQFRFWGQLIRWAASDRPLGAGNAHLRFGVRDPATPVGKPVGVVLRFTEERPENSGVLVRILRPDGGEARVVSLKRDAGNPLEWRAELEGLPPGGYRLEPQIPGFESKLRDEEGKPLSSPFRVLPPTPAEEIDLSTDFPAMNELAKQTGGKAVWAKDFREIPPLLRNREATRESSVEWLIGESWWLFGFVFLLLCVEWILRKVAGLA